MPASYHNSRLTRVQWIQKNFYDKCYQCETENKNYVILNLNRIASRPNDTKSYLQILSNALGILENILLKIIEMDNYNQV